MSPSGASSAAAGAASSSGTGTTSLKIVLLGEGRVGKTSLLTRFVRGYYDEHQGPSLSASFLQKRVNLPGDRPVNLNLWDTAGQERFHALGPIYYRGADAAMLVFDVSDAESFTKVKRWVAELRSMVDTEIPLVIAGNKSDLDKAVEEDQVQAYADSVRAKLFWTSALANRNVDTAFLSLSRDALEHAAKHSEVESFKEEKQASEIQIVEDAALAAPAPQSAGCC